MNFSPDEVEQLIRGGYNVLQETWDEIFKLEEQVSTKFPLIKLALKFFLIIL